MQRNQSSRANNNVREKRIDLPISGMTCASCVRRVEKGLNATKGVVHATVNLATKKATIQVNEKGTLPDLLASVHKMGYEVNQEETTFLISGMTCAACVRRIERAIKKAPGVCLRQASISQQKKQQFPILKPSPIPQNSKTPCASQVMKLSKRTQEMLRHAKKTEKPQ